MINNICRPFVLCNDFIPPTSEEHKGWRYFSWGYFDGIVVGQNLIENDTNKSLSFQILRDCYQKQSEALDGSYSTQIVYGIRTEDKNEKVKDCEFWEDDNTCIAFPFVFITLIQAEKSRCEYPLSEAWKKVPDLENELNCSNGDYKAITYITLDSSDMILVIRSKNYNSGAKIVDSLHRGNQSALKKCFDWNVKYTFTLASISKNFLEDETNIDRLDGTIDVAYLYMIEKKPNSISYIHSLLSKELWGSEANTYKIERQSVLGYNDEVIVLREVPWNKFVRLYCNDRGVLNHTNEDYKHNLNGVTTIIGLEHNVDNKKVTIEDHGCQGSLEKSDNVSNGSKDKCLCDVMREKCKERMLVNSKLAPESIQNLKRNVYQVINSLQKFESTPFSDYIFLSIALPLNMVLDMVCDLGKNNKKGKYNRNWRNNKSWKNNRNCINSIKWKNNKNWKNSKEYVKVVTELEMEAVESFYKFIKGLDLYIQNSNRSDRQFIQTPEFNIKIYDIPTKINAFYNAYVFNLKNYLNEMVEKNNTDNEHAYEFLFCPGAAEDLHVKELFKKKSETDRLFLIESPESDVFAPEDILIILTHEVGHVVGTGIRNREERVKAAQKIIGKIVCRYMKNGLRNYLNEQDREYKKDEEFWAKLEQNLIKMLEKDFESKDITENYSGEGKKLNFVTELHTERKYHSDSAKVILSDLIISYLNKESMWGYLVEREYLYWLEKNPDKAEQKKLDMKAKINEMVYYMIIENKWNKENDFNLGNVISIVFNLFQECLADLICILTLELSYKEYLGIVIKNSKKLGVPLERASEMSLRTMIVVYCMRCKNKNCKYWWKDEEISAIESEDEELQVSEIILKNLHIYLSHEIKSDNSVKSICSAIGMIYDTEIMREISKYLNECVKSFWTYNSPEDKDKKEQMKSKREYLKNSYRQFHKKDLNMKELVINMQIYIEKYLDELNKKHEEIINEKWGGKNGYRRYTKYKFLRSRYI